MSVVPLLASLLLLVISPAAGQIVQPITSDPDPGTSGNRCIDDEGNPQVKSIVGTFIFHHPPATAQQKTARLKSQSLVYGGGGGSSLVEWHLHYRALGVQRLSFQVLNVKKRFSFSLWDVLILFPCPLFFLSSSFFSRPFVSGPYQLRFPEEVRQMRNCLPPQQQQFNSSS